MASRASKGQLAKGFSLPKVEKKAAVPEEVAAAFIEGATVPKPASVVEDSPPPPDKAVRRGGLVPLPPMEEEPDLSDEVSSMDDGSSEGPKSSKLRRATRGERVAIYLPHEMAGDLRVRCAQQRRSISDAITVAVGKWLEEAP